MKTKNNLIHKLIVGAGLVAALSFMSGCTTNTSTGDQMKPMKGGEHQLMLNKIDTKEEADALKTDDSITMVCSKCKLSETAECGNAVIVKDGTKDVTYYIKDTGKKETYHKCSGEQAVKVTGKVSEKDGKKYLEDVKVENVK